MNPTLKFIYSASAVVCIVAMLGCNEPKEKLPHRFKWDVAVCNSVGCNHYNCDTYQVKGNTYYLFQSDSLTNQVTVTAGIAVIASKNQY